MKSMKDDEAILDFAFKMGFAFSIGVRYAANRIAQDAAKWITVHPGGKKTTDSGGNGSPVLIDDETGMILGGMGGKFTGKHISSTSKKSQQGLTGQPKHDSTTKSKSLDLTSQTAKRYEGVISPLSDWDSYEKSKWDEYVEDGTPMNSLESAAQSLDSVNNKTLSQKEEQVVYGYVNNDFKQINSKLRKGVVTKDARVLSSVIENSVVESPIRVYRGLSEEAIQKVLSGNKFSDDGFSSTSTLAFAAYNFGEHVLVFDLPKGFHAYAPKENGRILNECEVILNRGLTGSLVKQEKKGYCTFYHVKLDEPS